MPETEIVFYTHRLKPGEIARFRLITRARLGGEEWAQASDGVVILSQVDNSEVVLWPARGGSFATTPLTRGDTAAASRSVLAALRQFRARRAA